MPATYVEYFSLPLMLEYFEIQLINATGFEYAEANADSHTSCFSSENLEQV